MPAHQGQSRRNVEDRPPPECRICREPQPPLLQPCLCTSFVHQPCLARWTASRASSDLPLTAPGPPSCEICLAPYASKSASSASACEALDPLALLPRTALCATVLSLEACVLLILFVLAVSGHTFFLFRVYTPAAKTPGGTEYALQRLLLAVVNAGLTFGILALVRKIASRWLRESAQAAAEGGGNATGSGSGAMLLPAPASFGAGASSHAGQVTLGGVLSLVAGAEVYLLVSAL